MSTLHVLGSGSRGNCFAFGCDGATLLLDAGFSSREIERRAPLADLDLGTVTGIALTHEHGDHASGAAQLARRLGVPVLTAAGTWLQVAVRATDVRHVAIGAGTAVEFGPFRLRACAITHDAADPLALAVEASDGTSVGLAYDLGRATAALRWLLRDRTAVILEANHDEVLLRTSGYPPSVQHRIAGSGGHLSNRAAAELLAGLCHPGLSTVVLAHLSQRCNTADAARDVVEAALRRAGFLGGLHVALQDEPLPPLPVELRAGRQLALPL